MLIAEGAAEATKEAVQDPAMYRFVPIAREVEILHAFERSLEVLHLEGGIVIQRQCLRQEHVSPQDILQHA